MLEKFCRWWPIWYLLFFCHGSEGQLQWVVKEKVTAYGQNLILFCPVENCCSEPAGWFVGSKTIILDIKTFSNDPKVKYHGTYNKDGFGVVIRNLSEADLNVTYRCIYGFDESTPKYLLHGDVFRENVPDDDKEIDTAAIVVAIVVIMVGAIIGMTCVYISRIKKKRQKQTECIGVEIIQKGPITVGYGGTIKINAIIISNSTGSLKVNWQKIHNNCSINLMINRLKYSGSFCNVNNPELVINDFGKEDAGIYKLEVASSTKTVTSPGILLELYGDEADSLSKGGNNFFRLYLLCQKIATQAVRDFFDSKVPKLESFLKQHKSVLTSKSSVEQRAILFPGGQVAVDSADFDFTLLYKLIRNLATGIPAPTRRWGNKPLPTHINETDDIERIRDLRNELAHNSELEICDTDFSTHWTDLSRAIDRLSKGSLSTDVESMRMKKFDKCIINEKDIQKEQKEIREEFMELQKNVTECETDIADNKQNIADNRQEIDNINTRHIPLHIKSSNAALIKNWREEDQLFYHKTQGFRATLEMVKEKKYMTIIGGPGSGKTATARHIALQLEEKGCEVVPVCELSDIKKYGDRDHKQVFVLDDVVGIFAVKIDHMINYQEHIFTAIGEESKLLFTCRKSVYNEALEHKSFVTKNVIDLQSKDNQLTETEKVAICKYHCEAKGVNPNLYTSLSFTEANHMFPLLCKLFSEEKQYQRLGERFFNKPFDCFISVLDKLLKNNAIQYAVLVLCLVNKGKLSVNDLPDEHMRRKVFDCCGVNLDTPVKNINDTINHMSETYFTKLYPEYTFSHDFIFEVIAFHYGQSQNVRQNQEQILKYLSSSYIANKVTVYEQDSNEDYCIQISEDMYSQLAERLYKDIQSMNLFDVFMNKSLKHGPFLDVFEEMLKTKPFDEFESLILRKHQNIHQVVQNIPSSKEDIKKQSYIAEHRGLYLLFDSVYCRKSDSIQSFRVINWIINYGHTHLLKEIVNHVECNNNSINLIFGSNVEETTHLLILGCYSNTLDMVELILKYVDPKCINMDYNTSSNIEYYVFGMYTPLMAACTTGNLCIVKALLRNKVDVNECNVRDKSPLLVAIGYGHVDVVRCLLSSGADVNLRDEYGQSPLCNASESGHYDIVKYLVAHDHNAGVNLTDGEKRSPLFIASMKGHFDIVKYLVAHDAGVNLTDGEKRSPLFIASMKGHFDIVKYLVAHDAGVNLTDGEKRSPLFIASMKGHFDIVNYLVAHNADVNLTDTKNRSPLFIASMEGHFDIVKYLVAHNADVNLTDRENRSPLFIASMEGHFDIVKYLMAIVRLLIAHGALSAGNAKSQFKSISKRTNGNEIFSDSNALLNPCRYPEEKISHSKEKQEEKKEEIYVAKVQEGKKETVFTREQEEKEEIIYSRETKEENEETIDRRKEQVEKGELVNTRKGEEEIVEVVDLPSFSVSYGGDALLPDVGNKSPLSIAVQKGHLDIVKYIIENSTDFDLSDAGKSPLFLAAEEGCPDILVFLLHSKYNDIAKTYLGTTPLEIAVWRNKTKVVQLLIQEENKLQKYQGNCHLFKILVDLKRSEFCINEKTGEEDCHAKDRNHRHLPYPLWHIITTFDNDYLTHLLKIGLDINKRDYNGNTLLYKILNRNQNRLVDSKLKILMEYSEKVNTRGTDFDSLLKAIDKPFGVPDSFLPRYFKDIWSEVRKHVRRHSI